LGEAALERRWWQQVPRLRKFHSDG